MASISVFTLGKSSYKTKSPHQELVQNYIKCCTTMTFIFPHKISKSFFVIHSSWWEYVSFYELLYSYNYKFPYLVTTVTQSEHLNKFHFMNHYIPTISIFGNNTYTKRAFVHDLDSNLFPCQSMVSQLHLRKST